MMKKTLPGAVILAAISAWLYFCWPALQSLHLRWVRLDEAYAVGYPIVFMALLWLFDRRRAILHEATSPAYSALFLLLLVLLISASGSLIYLQVIPQLAMPALLWLLIAALLGWRSAFAAVGPCAILYLAIPWMDISDPLRSMTVWFCQHVLDWLEIPAMIDGFDIKLTSGILHVAGSCSGLNLLLSALFTGVMYGEVARQPVGRRILFVALAAVVGIVDNWIRVLVLVLIAHYSNMTSGLIYEHGSLGWWVFAASLIPYFFAARRLEVPVAETPQRGSKSTSFAMPQMAVSAMLVIGLMLGTLVLLNSWGNRNGAAANGFELPAAALTSQPLWMPHYQHYDVVQSFAIPGDLSAYEVLALVYVQQRADRKLIYYDNYIAGEDHLRSAGRIAVAPGFNVNTAIVTNGGSRVVWWFWWVDGDVSVSPLKTKLLQLKAALVGDPSAALLMISKSCESSACATEVDNPPDSVREMLKSLREMKIAKPSLTGVPRSE